MRFLHNNKIRKTVLVISDLHLGAGVIVNNRKNFLENFHNDRELVEFLKYFSSGDFAKREIDLIINGDFVDFLSVPFVKYFDDEFWSEKASNDKLKLIIDGHKEVFESINKFLLEKNKKIIYILGNHDAELVFKSNQQIILEQLSSEIRDNFKFIVETDGEYYPAPGVLIKHGHEFEVPNSIDYSDSIITDSDNNQFFLPPWGSYYVTRVVNKFKEQRHYIDAVRPVNKFIINGLIYDTLFTLRFVIANIYYFFMVRFIFYFKQHKNIKKIFEHVLKEVDFFNDEESLTQDFFEKREDIKTLIIGHTHLPIYRPYLEGHLLINTGSWTKMYSLDIEKRGNGRLLTFAQIDISDDDSSELDIVLNIWFGNNLPFYEFR